jgi:hypothetical protein
MTSQSLPIIHYNFRSLVTLPGVHPQLLKLWDITRVPLIDRTRSLEFPFEYEILSPMPQADQNFDTTFEQLCISRAENIWKTCVDQEKHLNVYWSGGIDSTCVLISLLKTAHADHLALITVLMNMHSRQEYPSFFENHIQNKLKYKLTGATTHSFRAQDLHVTGEIGDQLFGSMWMIKYLGQFDRLFMHDIPQHMEPLTGTDNNTELLEYMDPLLKAAPFEICCVYDLVWWLNFSCKWQDVQLRFIKDVDSMTRDTFFNSICHFFDTEEFQLWSMKESNHRNLKVGPKWNTYKKEAKQFIYDFTQDAQYRDFKRKIPSLRIQAGYPYKARLSDFSMIAKGEPLCKS